MMTWQHVGVTVRDAEPQLSVLDPMTPFFGLFLKNVLLGVCS
jgi:hypothetical protein